MAGEGRVLKDVWWMKEVVEDVWWMKEVVKNVREMHGG